MNSSHLKRRAMLNYLVATTKPWNIKIFKEKISRYPGGWFLVSNPQKLTPALVKKIKPRYIFFPHWSWIVPKEILALAECVCFHETDLPYGRGGSPVQNLIFKGHQSTMISAIRMKEGLDNGPIYLKKPASLKGSAQEIFERNARIVAEMIKIIVSREIAPKPQQGPPTVFKRRTPDQSNLATLPEPTLEKVYDLIRMLDAETYPKAFLEVNGLRLEFANTRKLKDKLCAMVEIRRL